MCRENDLKLSTDIVYPECNVCSGPAKFHHFGMQICRGCASFFQRCLKNEKRYDCLLGQHNCKIHYRKISKCRSCRFALCLTMWNAEERALLAHEFIQNNKEIKSVSNQLIKAYHNYHEYQLNLVSERHSIQNLTQENYIEPDHNDVIVNGNASLKGLFRIFGDCISYLKEMDQESWTTFTRDSQLELFFLQQAYLTNVAFKGTDTSRAVLMPGYIIDVFVTTKYWWFKDATEEERRKFDPYIDAIHQKTYHYFKTFKSANPSLLDMTVFMLLTIYRHYENASKHITEFKGYKDRVLYEWAESLREQHEDRSHNRMIELLKLCDETVTMTNDCYEWRAYVELMNSNGAKLSKTLLKEAQIEYPFESSPECHRTTGSL